MNTSIAKKIALSLVAVAFVAATGIVLAAHVAQPFAAVGQHGEKQFSGRMTRKKAKVSAAVSLITVEMRGLNDSDVLNIRPSKKAEVEVSATTLHRGATGHVERAEDVPESAIEVSGATVTFDRPATAGIVIVDVEVPAGVQTAVVVNGSRVLSSSLSEPLSIRRQVVAPGAKSAAAAVVMASLPEGALASSGEPRKLKDGVVFVPFEQLQVTKSVPVWGDVLSARAMLSIDENGRVTQVRPSGDAPAAGLEENLRQREFAPYMVEGRAVKVITIYAKKN